MGIQETNKIEIQETYKMGIQETNKKGIQNKNWKYVGIIGISDLERGYRRTETRKP